jgi:ferredoxin
MKDNAPEVAAAAEETLRQIAGEIAAGARNKIPRTKHIYNMIYRRFVAAYPKKGLGFHAGEGCTGCGQCARLCPAGNIAMQNGKPVFGAKCEQCVACIQWCPQAAIQYKEETQARKRYHHPQVTLREFMTKQGG